MEHIVPVLILFLLIGVGMLYTVRHFRRKSGCCGSQDYRAKANKLPTVICEQFFEIEGMHCEHCKSRVEEAVNDLEGVACRVFLDRGEAKVSYAKPVEDETIRFRVERLGYRVITIRDESKTASKSRR